MVSGTRPLYLFNTLGRELQLFEPLEPGCASVYTCGPTVYSYAHIGNFRAFLLGDTIRRVLEYNGYEVRQVRNITDVGHLTNETLADGLDRMELAAQRQGKSPWDIAAFYTDAFLGDAERLNLLTPYKNPRATEYIDGMIALAERLIESGHAYESQGNVYFAVDTFPRYGALSGNTVDDLIAGSRVEIGDAKRSPADFAIWRATEPDRIMRWPSPWGAGVPGWHLECSAMAMELLGQQIDIHSGGVDNIFPHHEDEIAQSEGATGQRFARYWLHSEWLKFGEEKMSKSMGNIYTISDLEENGVHPLAYRYFTHQAHYRTPLNFTWDALEGAYTALRRLWEQAAEMLQSEVAMPLDAETQPFRERFHDAINRDLDLPGAVAVLHDALGTKLAGQQKLALLTDFDSVLGLGILDMAAMLSVVREYERPILDRRAAARRDRDWPRSDELRTQLANSGLDVKDTPSGQRWVRSDVLPAANRQQAE